ncbi:MAG: hypothetical protein B7X86_12645 [Sphingobacteriales bacterium 17-39-43]|nr:MAG: hypothetical protein B7Y24_12585 [Sphingobacteriales bacterium 16-39-50]OZA23396.1 MAG: hypothetical protein B7X86_12645 [Sphingobacteriales bacterium 17-39-43]
MAGPARLYAIALPLDIISKQNNCTGKGCRFNPVYEPRVEVINLVQEFPNSKLISSNSKLRFLKIVAVSGQAKRDRSGSFLPN